MRQLWWWYEALIVLTIGIVVAVVNTRYQSNHSHEVVALWKVYALEYEMRKPRCKECVGKCVHSVWICLSVLLSVGPVLGICCQCILLLSRHNPGVDNAIRLHALHVSACCGHHQVHRAFTIALSSICYTYPHWPVFTHWECVVLVCCLYNALMLWSVLKSNFFQYENSLIWIKMKLGVKKVCIFLFILLSCPSCFVLPDF
jgi:hypothetical protein